jgi:hypothetical protein
LTITAATVVVSEITVVAFLAQLDHTVAAVTRNVGGTADSAVYWVLLPRTRAIPIRLQAAFVVTAIPAQSVAIVAVLAFVQLTISASLKAFRAILAIGITTVSGRLVAIIAGFSRIE